MSKRSNDFRKNVQTNPVKIFPSSDYMLKEKKHC